MSSRRGMERLSRAGPGMPGAVRQHRHRPPLGRGRWGRAWNIKFTIACVGAAIGAMLPPERP
ncbi:MAG: hypothetical protein GEU73_11765 [Chloroflexi bacterium]|nr:hypothetical protein [Chloroflexota bacterium]